MPSSDTFRTGSLAPREDEKAQVIRQSMEDAIQDYGPETVVSELLQNAIDALDRRRYLAICAAASQEEPDDPDTVKLWNDVIEAVLDSDQESFDEVKREHVKLVSLHADWLKSEERREAWWMKLAESFGGQWEELRDAASSESLSPYLRIRYSPDTQVLEIEENGIGMNLVGENARNFIRHHGSTKRPDDQRKRQYGVRGAHGWGLQAVLGRTNSFKMISKEAGGELAGVVITGSKIMANGGAEMDARNLSDEETQSEIEGRPLLEEESGTIVKIELHSASETRSVIGDVLDNWNLEMFENYLRIYTPVGQCNDYVLHPAFHTWREEEMDVAVQEDVSGNEREIAFAYLALKDLDPQIAIDLPAYRSAAGNSVHTVSRWKANRNRMHVLVASEIQETKIFTEKFEKPMRLGVRLPGQSDDPNDESKGSIPRGFKAAYSGGLLSDWGALEPRGNLAMHRGVALGEQEPPTLARRSGSHKMDGRSSLGRASDRHASLYNKEVRLRLKSTISGGGSPAELGEKANLLEGIIAEAKDDGPWSDDRHIWTPSGSKEARVMLVFAELLQRGSFGPMKILRCGLKDTYDFTFWTRQEIVGPDGGVPQGGIAEYWDGEGLCDKQVIQGSGFLDWLGFGEFKADGYALFDDVGPAKRIKSLDMLDLLVCWNARDEDLEHIGWTRTSCTGDADRIIPGQTHWWIAESNADFQRDYKLPVVELEGLLVSLHGIGPSNLKRPEDWPDIRMYWAGRRD